MRPVKKLILLSSCLALVASSLTSCTTLANRRDLYNPTKPKGPYTDMWIELEGIGPTQRHGVPNR